MTVNIPNVILFSFSVQKEIQQISVEDYVNRRTADTAFEEVRLSEFFIFILSQFCQQKQQLNYGICKQICYRVGW